VSKKVYVDLARAEEVWKLMHDKTEFLLLGSTRSIDYIIDVYENVYNMHNLSDYYILQVGTGISKDRMEALYRKKSTGEYIYG
jgi:hypothetical protein